MSANESDPYVVLGVSPGISREELKRRYRELAKRWHPDRRRGDTDADRHEADRQMKLINAAYHSLSRVDPSQWEARERAERERGARAERERAERDARGRSRFASVTFSDRTTFHPVGLVFPRRREGYTIRIRVDEDDDDVIFLARGRRLMLFRSPESMASFLLADTQHELTRLPAWKDIRRSMAKASLEPDVDDYFDFDFVLRALGRPPEQWVPRAFVACRDMVFEVAKAFRHKKLLEIVALGSPLDQMDDLLRIVDEPFAGWGARRNLRRLSASHLSTHWRLAVTEIQGIAYWHG